MKIVLTAIEKFLALLLIQIVLITGFVFTDFGNDAKAWADTSTPEASSYQVDKTAEQFKLGAKQAENNLKDTAKNTKNALEETAENVKEKLNLDEPLPSDTKKFFRQIQGKEPIANERMPQINE